MTQDFRLLERVLEAYNQTHNNTIDIIDVPFRQNRCLLFRSYLPHKTGPIRFHEGYSKRRINLTFMYGVSEEFRG
jgi:hypothetical protein